MARCEILHLMFEFDFKILDDEDLNVSSLKSIF